MEQLFDLSWWLRMHARVLFAGAAFGMYWIVQVKSQYMDAEMFASVVRRLIEAGNVPRALKLSNAGHPVPVCVATKAAILAAARVGVQVSAARSGYRGGPNAALPPILTEITRDYDEAFRNATAPLWKGFFLALPSPLLLALAAWGSFESRGSASFTWGMAVAATGILALGYAGYCHVQIVLSRERVFQQLAPLFEKIARDGGRGIEAQELSMGT
ncbi:hypothetical protein [Polyangium mundeleinium]|uniref:Uncharacterized protein n=1 Tax=Polyangium mundeleinium TaxID=2995306 RepID=A0ABT5ELA5_9BACT|nr:hypothetical protein [Polyangium mundeleinium]MDC0742576.1 hypothetical protein [Polyangium mundeleinium]